MSRKSNYMDDIYGVIYSPEVVYDDGIEYLDDPEEFNYIDDELSWADDIIYLDEPEDEEFNYDLGEGFIPLPQGNIYDEPVTVIDENYILDEYESDIVEGVTYIDDFEEDVKEIQKVINNKEDYVPDIDLDNVESLIKLPEDKSISEELSLVDVSPEDDKISKAIAREFLDNSGNSTLELLSEEFSDPSDDTSWVDNPDLFGNDINVILADNPDKVIEDDDYVDGSFEDWLKQNDSVSRIG